MSVRESVKKLLKSNALGRVLYEPLHKLWKMYNDPRKRRRLQKHGDETLQKLHDFFAKNGIEYYVDFGTLLGVVREDGFIKHDDDIDLTIRKSPISAKKMYQLMEKEGFTFCHGLYVDNKTIVMTVYWNKLSVDLFFVDDRTEFFEGVESYVLYGCYYVPEQNYPSPNANNYRAWFFPANIRATQSSFHGYEICVPNNAELLLEMEYGKGWRTPIKGFEPKQEDFKYKVQDGFAYRTIDPNELPE